jgi:hypothetical protein
MVLVRYRSLVNI